jgi:hypothetical protein
MGLKSTVLNFNPFRSDSHLWSKFRGALRISVGLMICLDEFFFQVRNIVKKLCPSWITESSVGQADFLWFEFYFIFEKLKNHNRENQGRFLFFLFYNYLLNRENWVIAKKPCLTSRSVSTNLFKFIFWILPGFPIGLMFSQKTVKTVLGGFIGKNGNVILAAHCCFMEHTRCSG